MRVLLVVTPVLMWLVAPGLGQAPPPEPKETPPTLVGTWGGDRIRVDGSASGARIQVDCLLARVGETIALDKAGAFAISAAFAPIRGVAIDGDEERPLVRMSGRLEKDALQITIGPEGGESAGTFVLRRNAKATLPNCKMRS